MLPLLITLLLFTAAFLLIEHAQKKFRLNHELTRKLAHVTGAGGAALLPYWLNWNAIMIVASVFIMVMYLSKKKQFFKAIHNVKRTTYGEIYLPAAVLVLAVFVRIHAIYAYAMLILAFADVVAQIVGQKYGKHNIQKRNKTWEGTLSFMVVSFVIGLVILSLAYSKSIFYVAGLSLLVATVAGFSEAVLEGGADNLAIPLVVALVCRTFL